MPHRIVIIGTGLVGTSLAFALTIQGQASEIVLIDKDKDRAKGHAIDLNHGLPFAQPISIRAGDYSDCALADIIVIAAGVNQQPGETRLSLLQRNVDVFQEIITKTMQENFKGIFLIATNPVDILSYATYRLSEFPATRVIGSGTILDTARFRYLLGKNLDIDPRSIHAMIIGEHGDSEVPVFSTANVAGLPIKQFKDLLSEATLKTIVDDVRLAAYEIIKLKGATHFAIALGLSRIIESILKNQNSVLTVSTLLTDYAGISDVYLGIPAIVNRQGVVSIIDLPLDKEERQALINSANILKAQISSLHLDK